MQSITCSCIMDRSIFLLESFSNLLLISNAIIWTHQELGWLVIACKITDICCIVDEYYCKVMLKHYFTQRCESVFDCNIIVCIIQENMLHWIMQSKTSKCMWHWNKNLIQMSQDQCFYSGCRFEKEMLCQKSIYPCI